MTQHDIKMVNATHTVIEEEHLPFPAINSFVQEGNNENDRESSIEYHAMYFP